MRYSKKIFFIHELYLKKQKTNICSKNPCFLRDDDSVEEFLVPGLDLSL